LGELAARTETHLIAIETTLRTRAALARLETPLRDAVELMYVAGLTAPEISAQFGIAEGTVRSRVARGLEKLGRALRSVGSRP
jgi:RNA polymerase sigma factor (sigma-70 family)